MSAVHMDVSLCRLQNVVQMVELLLRRGADVGIKDHDEQTPSDYATLCGHMKVNVSLPYPACDSGFRPCIDQRLGS